MSGSRASAALALAASPAPRGLARQAAAPAPYRQVRSSSRSTSAGPGREEPEPDVAEVVLGWFGPGDPDHPDFGELWRGATLALEQENAAGGYRGKPLPPRCPPGRRALEGGDRRPDAARLRPAAPGP